MSPQPQPALTPTEFSSAVTAITSAFGDPTRREIYLFVHARSEADPEGQPGSGVTAADVAEQFLLHPNVRSDEHTSELQSLMRISNAVFYLKKKKKQLETS